MRKWERRHERDKVEVDVNQDVLVVLLRSLNILLAWRYFPIPDSSHLSFSGSQGAERKIDAMDRRA
ncbi:hypothetical protein D3C73_1537430 [compost metagenome]